MCAVSMIGDEYAKQWPNWPQVIPFPPTNPINQGYVSRKEFDELKEEMERIKKLLEEAKKQDVAEGNADCQKDEKVAILQKIADALGVDLGDVFK